MKAKLRSILSIVMVMAVILTFSMPAGTAFAGTAGISQEGGNIFSKVGADWSIDGITVSLEMNVESDSKVEVVDAHICPASNTEDGYYTDIRCGEFEGDIRNAETEPREWQYEGTADISGIRYSGQGEYSIYVTLKNDMGQESFILKDFGMDDIDLGYDPLESDMEIGYNVNLEDPIYGASAFRGDGKVIKNVVQDGAKLSFTFENAGIGYIYEYDRDSLELKNIISYQVGKKSAVLKFDSERVTKSISDAPFTNSISKETDADVTYSSSDAGVAVVERNTGEVTVKNTGSAVITAKAAETDNFKAAEVSYTIVVSKSVADYSYAFKNFGLKAPLSTCKYMYGDNTVATAVYDMNIGESGNCYGMSATSGLLCVKNDISVSDFNGAKKKIGELVQEDKCDSLGLSVLDFIQGMHITQVSAYMGATKIDNSVPEDMEKFISVLKEETAKGKAVMVCATSKGSGHAVLAYGINQVAPSRGVDEYQILIYDNNYPEQERIMTLEKWEDGVWSWNYEVAKRTYWGTYDTGGTLQYTTYDEYYKIWENRGNLISTNKNLIRVSSDNFSLYSNSEKLIAEVKDGVLETAGSGVIDVTPVDIMVDEDEEIIEQTAESTVLWVPVDKYKLTNDDESDDTIEATMVNKVLGVTVSTEADEITLYAEDKEEKAGARLESTDDEKYEIKVLSSALGDNSYVQYSGEGSDVEVEYMEGNAAQNLSDADVEQGEKNTLDFNEDDGITASLSKTSYTYDGKAKKPAVTVENYGEAIDPSNYTVKYENNVNAGTATAVITGKGSCSGTLKIKYEIKPLKITKMNFGYKNYFCTGKNRKPVPEVYAGDIRCSSFKVTRPSETKKPGTYKVSVEGTGNFTGKLSKTYNVIVKSTYISSKKAKRKGFRVTARKQTSARVTAYQFRYSKYESMKNAKKTSLSKKNYRTVKKLKAKKTYYVQVRTYKTIDGKKYYSKWSSKKKIRTK